MSQLRQRQQQQKQQKKQKNMDATVIECMENTTQMKDLSKAIVIQSTHQPDTNKTVPLMRCFLELGEACDFNLLLLANKSPNSPHYFTFLEKMMKQGDKEFRQLDGADSRQFAELRNTYAALYQKMKRNFALLKKN